MNRNFLLIHFTLPYSLLQNKVQIEASSYKPCICIMGNRFQNFGLLLQAQSTFRDIHSSVHTHVAPTVNYGISCKARPIFITRSSVFTLNIIIRITSVHTHTHTVILLQIKV
jgi:hypothetical protein